MWAHSRIYGNPVKEIFSGSEWKRKEQVPYPNLSLLEISTPLLISIAQMSVMPPTAAQCSGVRPFLSSKSVAAPSAQQQPELLMLMQRNREYNYQRQKAYKNPQMRYLQLQTIQRFLFQSKFFTARLYRIILISL